MSDRELIRYHVDGKVGVITIDRPEKRNAMTYAMLGDFIETVGQADDDPDTVVLVVTGVAGSVLCRDRPGRPGDRAR